MDVDLSSSSSSSCRCRLTFLIIMSTSVWIVQVTYDVMALDLDKK